jgi:hypothetical protein
MTENPKLDTVRKLLAKAEKAGTPEEAETYAAKAEELMARYSIDAALLASRSERDESMGSRSIRLEGYPIPKAMILNAIAKNLSCRVVLSSFRGMPGTKVATIYGHASDLEAFDILATSLLLQATTAATAWHKRPGAAGINGRTFRHNFLIGFATRVNERMAAAKEEAAVATDDYIGTALVLVDRSAQVDRYVAGEHPKLGTSKTQVTHSRSYLAGDAAGQQADLSTNARVGGTTSKAAIG